MSECFTSYWYEQNSALDKVNQGEFGTHGAPQQIDQR